MFKVLTQIRYLDNDPTSDVTSADQYTRWITVVRRMMVITIMVTRSQRTWLTSCEKSIDISDGNTQFHILREQ